MIKTLIFLSLLSLGGVKTQTDHLFIVTPPKEQLTEPAGWDFIYEYQSDYTAFTYRNNHEAPFGYIVKYGDVDIGADYEFVSGYGQADLYGFEDMPLHPSGLGITLTFDTPTTSWESSAYGYYPDSAYVGASDFVSDSVVKFRALLTNATTNDYLFYFDFSSTIDSIYYESEILLNGSPIRDTAVIPVLLSSVLLSSGNTISFDLTHDESIYFDAMYIVDLGLSSGSYSSGYIDGYDDGYYDYVMAINDAYDSGYESGYSNGVATGYDEGYDDGHDDGYQTGVLITEGDAYDEGYEDGSNESFMATLGDWIVPAIIVVLLLGGAISIWSYKKREQ